VCLRCVEGFHPFGAPFRQAPGAAHVACVWPNNNTYLVSHARWPQAQCSCLHACTAWLAGLDSGAHEPLPGRTPAYTGLCFLRLVWVSSHITVHRYSCVMSENGLTGHPPPPVAHSCFHSTQFLVQEVHTPPRPCCCCARSCIEHNCFPSSDLLSAIRCRLLLGWLAWPVAVRQSGRSSQPGRMGCFTVPQVVVLSGRRPLMAFGVLPVSLRSDVLKCCGRCRDSCAMGSRLMRPATHLLFGIGPARRNMCLRSSLHFLRDTVAAAPTCVRCLHVFRPCHLSPVSFIHVAIYPPVRGLHNGRCKQLSAVSLASSL
jgi:hypothetical protein